MEAQTSLCPKRAAEHQDVQASVCREPRSLPWILGHQEPRRCAPPGSHDVRPCPLMPHAHTSLKYRQGWELHHLPRQLIPVLVHTLSMKKFFLISHLILPLFASGFIDRIRRDTRKAEHSWRRNPHMALQDGVGSTLRGYRTINNQAGTTEER